MFSTKYIILFIGLYLAALLQASFLPHFKIYGGELNLIFVIVFIVSFFQKAFQGARLPVVIFVGFLAGLFLDFFSPAMFGFYAIAFALMALLIAKTALSFERVKFLSFLLVFVPFFVCFHILSFVVSRGAGFLSLFDPLFFIFSFIFNFVIASFLYLVVRPKWKKYEPKVSFNKW